MPAIARQRSVASPTRLIAPIVRDALTCLDVPEANLTHFGVLGGGNLELRIFEPLGGASIDMIRPPSGVTAITFASSPSPIPFRAVRGHTGSSSRAVRP